VPVPEHVAVDERLHLGADVLVVDGRRQQKAVGGVDGRQHPLRVVRLRAALTHGAVLMAETWRDALVAEHDLDHRCAASFQLPERLVDQHRGVAPRARAADHGDDERTSLPFVRTGTVHHDLHDTTDRQAGFYAT